MENRKEKKPYIYKFKTSESLLEEATLDLSYLSRIWYYYGIKTEVKSNKASPYRARYFPSKLMDMMEAGLLSSLLCPILFHVLMSQTAVTALLPAF